MRLFILTVIIPISLPIWSGAAEFTRFQTQEIDPHAGEVCYAVTVADLNGDQKLDVVAVTEDAVVWYENPSWRKADIVRKSTARDNVCIQPHDTKTPSPLQWLGRDEGGRWQVHPIHFEQPTLHRFRWGDVKGTGKKQL